MSTFDSYHESQTRKLIFKTDLIYNLLDNSYVASSLVRQHYSPSDPAWQSLHDKLDEYRELLRKAQSLLEHVEDSVKLKMIDNSIADNAAFLDGKVASETPF